MFTCAATGIPAPFWSWEIQKGGAKIAFPGPSTYTINNTQPGDAGTYKCIAINAVASASAIATLAVHGELELP